MLSPVRYGYPYPNNDAGNINQNKSLDNKDGIKNNPDSIKFNWEVFKTLIVKQNQRMLRLNVLLTSCHFVNAPHDPFNTNNLSLHFLLFISSVLVQSISLNNVLLLR